MRKFHLDDLRLAARKWEKRGKPAIPRGQPSRKFFLRYAKGWLRFHGKLVEPRKWNEPLDLRVRSFAEYLKIQLGFAPRTIEKRIWSINRFLLWIAERDFKLGDVVLSHVERYLDHLSATGSKPQTIATRVQELQVFFRFAEKRRWSSGQISRGIFGPRLYIEARHAKGPAWNDVRRMIESAKGDTYKQSRAHCILLLASIYALRTGEITNLRVSDVDFKENTLTVRRGKTGLTQHFPMSAEVNEAFSEYIHRWRPSSAGCPEMFVTVQKPYHRLQQASIYNVTQKHINRLGIESVNRGAHALRHACARHLLQEGVPIARVASLLGHSSTQYVAHYVQHSVEDLIPVAEWSLGDLWN
jgi:site-specific recombinase XerD